jgi:hypothetical protein
LRRREGADDVSQMRRGLLEEKAQWNSWEGDVDDSGVVQWCGVCQGVVMTSSLIMNFEEKRRS